MSPADNIYFDLPGGTRPNLETNFNVFGNVWFGYVGRAAGFHLNTLIIGAAAVDYGIYREINSPDLYAVTGGSVLWDRFDYDLVEIGGLHNVILRLDSLGQTHTRPKGKKVTP